MAEQEFKDFQNPEDASVDNLVKALDRAYHRPGLLMWRAFWAGFMSAVGAAFGTIDLDKGRAIHLEHIRLLTSSI